MLRVLVLVIVLMHLSGQIGYAFEEPPLIAVSLPESAQSGQYYADFDASSNGDGTASSPWNTLAAALAGLDSKSRPLYLNMRGTTDITSSFVWNEGGTGPGSEVVLTAWGNDSVTIMGYGKGFRIDAGYIIVDGKSFSSPQVHFLGANSSDRVLRTNVGSHHVILWRCEMSGGSVALMYEGNYNKMLNCRCHTTSSHCVYVTDADYPEIHNNLVYDTTRNGIQTNPHEVGHVTLNGVYDGNALYNIGENGFTVLSSGAGDGHVNGLLISNNRVWDCGYSALKFTGSNGAYAGTIEQVKVYHNTFDSVVINQQGIVGDPGNPANTTIKGNIVTGGFTDVGIFLNEATKNQDNFIANPLFVSTDPLSAYHLELSPSSPCIDTATDLGIDVDCMDRFRPQGSGYDFGAFEFAAGVTPYPPRNLTIVDQ